MRGILSSTACIVTANQLAQPFAVGLCSAPSFHSYSRWPFSSSQSTVADLSLRSWTGHWHRLTTEVLALEARLGDGIPLVLLFVEVAEADPEADTSDEGQAGYDGVVPDEQGVLG